MKELLVTWLAAGLLLLPLQSRAENRGGARPEKRAGQKQKKSAQQRKGPSEPDDIHKRIARIVRDLQFALEGSSAQGVLALIDSAKFPRLPKLPGHGGTTVARGQHPRLLSPGEGILFTRERDSPEHGAGRDGTGAQGRCRPG